MILAFHVSLKLGRACQTPEPRDESELYDGWRFGLVIPAQYTMHLRTGVLMIHLKSS